MDMTHRHRVLILGAGFGGLAAARELDGHGLDVTLVDQRNHHTFQPLLYQVATAGLDASDVCYPTRRFARRLDGVSAVQATAASIDLGASTVELDDGSQLSYDALVLAIGGVTADFGVPGVSEHAFGLKSAAEAEMLRSHVLQGFERAARRERSGREQCGCETVIVVVGGGPTGVEMAGGWAELTQRVLLPDHPELAPTDVRVVLVERGSQLLPGFSPRLGLDARDRLLSMGVEVRVDTVVTAVTPTAVHFEDGTSIDTATVVWAAGIRAHPLAEQLGVALGPGGRIVVDDRLRIPGTDNVWVVGDLAGGSTPTDSLPQVAPVAMQGGRHAARQILAGLGRVSDPGPFRYRDKGSMATIGRNAAVVELPNGMRLTGFAGWVAWLGLHLVMLMGFRNRASVFVNWAWNYLTYDRGSRAVLVAPGDVQRLRSAHDPDD